MANELITFNHQENDEPSNYEQKCLCVFVLDTSGSMNKCNNIEKLNNGLKSFQEAILADPVAKDRLEVALVTFDSMVKVIQTPALMEDIKLPRLEASGQTRLVAGIEQAQQIVTDRKVYYKDKGLSYYRPFIVTMTDGDPFPTDQDIDGLSCRIHEDAASKKYIFMAIGIGDEVHDVILRKLATPDYPATRMEAVRFTEFFSWMSNSVSAIVADDCDTIRPEAPDWVNGVIIDTTND